MDARRWRCCEGEEAPSPSEGGLASHWRLEAEAELQVWIPAGDALANALRAKETTEWRDWCAEAFAGSGGRAHWFARPPEPWNPTAVLRRDGTPTADPSAVLEDAAVTWRSEWRAEDQEVDAEEWPWLPELDRSADAEQELDIPPPEAIRACSSSFSLKPCK